MSGPATLRRHVTIPADLERVADHATNIAEDVIYLVEGEIARHHVENVFPEV